MYLSNIYIFLDERVPEQKYFELAFEFEDEDGNLKNTFRIPLLSGVHIDDVKDELLTKLGDM